MNEGKRSFHFVGIGGAGMSGLALVLHGLGDTVTGSDRAASSYTERLEAAGVKVSIGHDAGNLPADSVVVVSTAIADDNPELARARELGLTVLHRGDLLAELAARKRCIAVSGTHGKTTTTAMVAHILEATGNAPSYFVGGEVSVGGVTANAGWGEGEWVVVEADESDRSFLKLRPDVAVVTNVELDHHSTYGGGLAELMESFAEFCGGTRELVVWQGQPELTRLAGDGQPVTGFAVEGDSVDGAAASDFFATALDEPADASIGTGFELHCGEEVHDGRIGVRGRHNVLNALAAIAAVGFAGVAPAQALAALATFGGVGRRFERIGLSPGGALVYDDYAHHPTEVIAALRTARAAAAGGRVVAVFQPHLYSRTQSLARDFGRALALADVVCVLDVYAAREHADDFPGVSGYLVATAAADAARGRPVYWTPSHELTRKALEDLLRAGDLCITLGAGDVSELGRALVAEAEAVA